MKKILLMIIGFAFALTFSDITQPYVPPFYAGYEERAEANGYVVVYGDSAWGTSIGLSASPRYSQDSAVVGFIIRQNCPTNEINDTACPYKPHRSYVIVREKGAAVGTTHVIGTPIATPAWIETWYYVSNLRLHGHGPGKINDWNSLVTVTDDTTENYDSVVTIDEDTNNYVHWQHVPKFGQASYLYQAGPSNDPTGSKKLTRGTWHLIQAFYDTKYTHRGSVWIDGKLTSLANIDGRLGGIAGFHAGLYASPACSTGTVLNDETYIFSVHDSIDGVFTRMATPPGR